MTVHHLAVVLCSGKLCNSRDTEVRYSAKKRGLAHFYPAIACHLGARATKAQSPASGDRVLRKPKTARREALWLEAVNKLFWTVDDLMAETGLSRRRIQTGLKRARDEPIEMPTVWDIEWRSSPNAFVEAHQCDWHGGENGTIPEDYPVGCLFCLKAGLTAMIRRHGRPIGSTEEQTDQALSAGEIAADVQRKGPAKFKPTGAAK